MIKAFEQYEQPTSHFNFIIGYPSGEYFDITTEQYLELHNAGLIFYDNRNRCFFFRDKNYKQVLDIVKDRTQTIKKFLEHNHISKYRINKDFSVDVFEHVKILGNFTELPVQFDFINGNFDISDCGLTTLKGCPDRVSGEFICINNNLRNLMNGPSIVEEGYNARYCGLKSLIGAPRVVDGYFDVGENELENLKGGPQEVDGDYLCDNCLLLSLQGCANRIAGNFNCSFNFLTDLKGGPSDIFGKYDCSNNRLKDLTGGPVLVNVFKCNGNPNMSKDNLPLYNKIISDWL